MATIFSSAVLKLSRSRACRRKSHRAENGRLKGGLLGALIGAVWMGFLLKKISDPPGGDAVKERPCSLMCHKNKLTLSLWKTQTGRALGA